MLAKKSLMNTSQRKISISKTFPHHLNPRITIEITCDPCLLQIYQFFYESRDERTLVTYIRGQKANQDSMADIDRIYFQ